MLIDGEKWACEACVRGHRVTTCKHHDRPLIRIARKGRPFSTCSVCNCTPCQAPEEHTKLRREAESKSQSSKKSSGRPSRANTAFLPIAPRPLESRTLSASHAAVSAPLPGTHRSTAGVVPARPRPRSRPSPRPRSSTDTDTNRSLTSQSPAHAHVYHRHHHHHPGARSTAPTLPLPVVTTAPPPPSHFPLSCGSFATPALPSVADIPVSLPMMDADGHGFLFGDGSGYPGDGVFSLDDLDAGAGALHAGMMQSEWGDQFWLGDDSV